MPDTKTSALGAATSLTGAEVIPAVQGGANVKIPLSLLTGAQSIATAGNTTTLTSSSPLYTVFTGSQGQTVVLPDATTLAVGRKFNIDNDSTQALAIKTNGGADLWTIAPGCDLYLTCLSVATAAGSWEKDYAAAKATTGLALTIDETVTVSSKLAKSGGTLTNYAETLYSATTSGNTTLDLANGNVQRVTLDAARTLTLPSSPGAVGKSFVLMLNCAGFAVTWNSTPTIAWMGTGSTSTPPSLNTTSAKTNVLTFVWENANTRWLGWLSAREP